MKLSAGSAACHDVNFMINAYGVSGPLLRVNMITSLDGAASIAGRSGPLGGPADQALMITLRMLADVVLVGAGTVRAEGYSGELVDERARRWRLDRGMPAWPRLAVVGRSGADFGSAAQAVRELGGLHVLCEGGPTLLGSLLAIDAVEELCLTVGPMLAGPGAGRIVAGTPAQVAQAQPMRLLHAIPGGDLLFLRYARVR